MNRIGVVLLFAASFLSIACSASAAGDILVTTVQLDDTGKVSVISVTQGPPTDQELPQYANPEYRIEIQRDGKRVSEQSFSLRLDEMVVLPLYDDKPSAVVKQTSTMQNLMLSLSAAGGTTDQYTIKVFKGGSEVFSSTLDKLPFTREAGVTDPIRSKEEEDLLKQVQPQASAPVETAPAGGFPWSFVIIAGAVLVAAIIMFSIWRHRKKNENYNKI